MAVMEPKRWAMLVATCSTSLIFLDQTAVVVALTAIQRDLGLGQLATQWIVNVYVLALAALTPVASRLGDVKGRLGTLAVGVVLFLSGSIAAALAEGPVVILAARALQGIGGSVLLPMSLAIISDTFPEADRGGALGQVLAIASACLALGPLIGGLIIEVASWRWVFWLNLPFAAAALALVLAMRPGAAGAPAARSLDVPGAVTFTAGLSAVSIALMQARGWGWTSGRTLGLLGASACLLVAFVKVESRRPHPLVSVPLLRNRQLLGAVITATGMRFVVLGGLVFAVLYLQVILGMSPLWSGIAILPGSAPLLVVPPIMGRMTDRIGPRGPMLLGVGITALALVWLTAVLSHVSYWLIAPGILLYGIGSAAVLTPTTTAAVNAVGPDDRGLASGLVSASRQIGGLLGMTGMAAVATNVEFHVLAASVAAQGGGPRELEQLDGLLSRGAAGIALAMRTISPDALDVCRRALLDAMTAAFALAAAICVLTFVLAGVMLPRRSARRPAGNGSHE